jgi:predicted transcriptional regulator
VKRDPLDLPVRRRIYDFIRENPGSHFRHIQRELGLAVGQVDFHLNYLVKGEVLVRREDSGKVLYYVRDSFSSDEKKALGILRRRIPRTVVLFLLEEGEGTPADMLEVLDISNGTLSYHLGRMVKVGLLEVRLEGRQRFYSLSDPDVVENLIIMFRTSLLDRFVDSIS